MKNQGVLNDDGLTPSQDQIHSLFSLEPTKFEIPEANREFLENLPPQRTYTYIDEQSPDWEGESKKLGKTIREDLIQDFGIAFKSKGDHTPSFAAIPPIEITVNEGVTPIHCTTASKIPAGMQDDCDKHIERLLQQGCIERYN